MSGGGSAMSVLAVLVTVLMSIATAMMLDYAAHSKEGLDAVIVAVAAAVLLVNVLKFALWGWIHRRYDLGKTYPVGTLFFPAIYVIAWLQGDVSLVLSKIAGILLIIVGIVLLQRDPRPGRVLS